ncbi:MAG: restriction endonuclease, partial [bacterium]
MHDKNDGYDHLRQSERAIKVAIYGNHGINEIEEEQKLLNELIHLEVQSELFQRDLTELQASPWNYSSGEINNLAKRRAIVRAERKLAVMRHEKKKQSMLKAQFENEIEIEELRISNKKINIAKTSIKEVDEMDGLEFELFIADIFKLKGYTIETTPVSGDFGVDLILNKNSIKSALQAKRYTGNVGVSAI